MKDSLNLKTPGAYPTYLSLGFNWAEENIANLDDGKHPSQLSEAR